MLRKGRKYSPEEILPRVKFPYPGRLLSVFNRKHREELDGDRINFATLRLQTFAAKGIDCVTCGIKGLFFIKEKQLESDRYYHLGFYALDEDGEEVLMTKDHIQPKSKGGKDTLDNMQPMCYPDNQDKGSNPEAIRDEEDL